MSFQYASYISPSVKLSVHHTIAHHHQKALNRIDIIKMDLERNGVEECGQMAGCCEHSKCKVDTDS
jgi:hypothetical protein